MGNLCCGEAEYARSKQQTVGGAAPPPKVMTPNDETRREQMRLAAEERARKDAVRGTQRYTPKPRPKTSDSSYTYKNSSGPDISDWT